MPRRLESCLLIAAHPDDETIGAGVWMKRYRGRLTVLHITDGSPLDLRDAHAAGFWSREEYASARRKELHTALALAQVSPKQCMQLGIVDQQAYLFMPDVAARLLEIARELEVTLLMSPAYEGGHPDHDAAAFATAAVRRRLGIPHREYRLYHAAPDGSLETRQFLSNSDDPGDVLRFSDAERCLKAEMIRAFRSQSGLLKQFPVTDEVFRKAPVYDFTRPPHEGPLMYERWKFPVAGSEWRERACSLMED